MPGEHSEETTEAHTAIIRILADDRELDSGVIEALQQTPGVQVRAQRLALGDYEVDAGCVFERKTMLDLAESLKDGRLFHQAHRLVNSGGLVAMILEGRGRDLIGSQMRREALKGALVSLSLVFGLPVLRSFGPEETARLLVYAARQLRRHPSDVHLRHGSRPRTKRRLQLKLLQGLPGIGPARAQQLLEHFGSVEAVMTASAEQLEGLPQGAANGTG